MSRTVPSPSGQSTLMHSSSSGARSRMEWRGPLPRWGDALCSIIWRAPLPGSGQTRRARTRSLRCYLVNRFVAGFSARRLSHDDAPTARSIPARGNAPGTCPSTCSALQGRRNPPPLQGAPIDAETQGVALGWTAAALSAPESKLCKSELTSLDGWPFMRRLLIMRPVVLVISVACVGDGETAVGQGRHLDGIHRSFVRDACRGCTANPQVGNELFGRIVVPGVNCVMQLPEILQSGRFLERLERSNGSAFFRAVVHYGHARMHRLDHHRQAGNVLPVMGHDVQIDCAHEVLGAGQIVFLVPRQIAKIDHAEFSQGDHHPNGLFIFTADQRLLGLIPRLEFRAQWIGGPGATQTF